MSSTRFVVLAVPSTLPIQPGTPFNVLLSARIGMHSTDDTLTPDEADALAKMLRAAATRARRRRWDR